MKPNYAWLAVNVLIFAKCKNTHSSYCRNYEMYTVVLQISYINCIYDQWSNAYK